MSEKSAKKRASNDDTEHSPKDNKKVKTEEHNSTLVTKDDPTGTPDKPIRVYADGMYLFLNLNIHVMALLCKLSLNHAHI